MKILGVIPARFGSTRFPGKPLAIIGGKPMIQQVYERAENASSLNKLIIATDDERIVAAAKSFDAEVMLTSVNHQSGTERCAEVIQKLHQAFDIIINIQGDEPFIHFEQIEEVSAIFQKEDSEIATLKKRIEREDELQNTNVVKVVCDANDFALYFSRATIPYLRNVPPENWLSKNIHFKHIGIYGYKTEILLKIVQLLPHPLEQLESLEQLRWLANGFSIKTPDTTYESSAIDAPEDLKKTELS